MVTPKAGLPLKFRVFHVARIALLALGLFFLAQAAAFLLSAPLMKMIDSQAAQLALFMSFNLLIVVITLQFAAVIQSRRGEKFSIRSLVGLRMPKVTDIGYVGLALFPYVIASLSLTQLVSLLFSQFDIEQAQNIGFSTSVSGYELLISFLSLVVITPILEEILFRGILFFNVRKYVSFWSATLVTSALFAAAHGQWNVGIDTFVLSIALCWLVEKTKGIAPSILLHAVKNGVAFIFLFVIK